MRNGAASVVLSLCLGIAFCTIPISAQSEQGLEGALQKALVGKSSLFRTPYTANRLQFDQSGKIKGTPEIGPWTTYGIVAIRSLELRSDSIQLKGERTIAVLRRVTSESQLELISTGEGVDITVALPPNRTTDAVKQALSAVLQGGDLDERLRSAWTEYRAPTEAKNTPGVERSDGVSGMLDGGRRVYGKGIAGKIQPPRVIYDPEPNYSGDALRNRREGRAVIGVVVNENGYPEILELNQALGDGLDVRALAAVARWRFRPGTLDGVAVPVQISVQVNFRLPY